MLTFYVRIAKSGYHEKKNIILHNTYSICISNQIKNVICDIQYKWALQDPRRLFEFLN